jgi:hypothetical protein
MKSTLRSDSRGTAVLLKEQRSASATCALKFTESSTQGTTRQSNRQESLGLCPLTDFSGEKWCLWLNQSGQSLKASKGIS